MSKLSCVTRSSSSRAVKRKSVSSRWTRCTLARPAFNQLKALPPYRLPPNILSAVSESLASRFTEHSDTLERSKRCQVVKRIGTTPRSKARPTVNLSNTPLTKANLDPKYHHLVSRALCFRHLAEVLRFRKGSKAASFAAARSANLKLAHLAYRTSASATPKTLAKIGTQDVSHLCGNRSCFEGNHLVIETRKKNSSREGCFEEERRRGEAPTKCSHKPACIFSTWRRHTFTLVFPIHSRRQNVVRPVAPPVAPPVAQQSLPRRSTDSEVYKSRKSAPPVVAHRRNHFYLDIPPL